MNDIKNKIDHILSKTEIHKEYKVERKQVTKNRLVYQFQMMLGGDYYVLITEINENELLDKIEKVFSSLYVIPF